MTKTELEQVREALWTLIDIADGEGALNCANDGRESLAILDAELANPEAREWRVSWFSWRGIERNKFESLEKARDFVARKRSGCELESRTPAGPWERAE